MDDFRKEKNDLLTPPYSGQKIIFPYPKVKGVCKDKLFASMLYASFPLI